MNEKECIIVEIDGPVLEDMKKPWWGIHYATPAYLKRNPNTTTGQWYTSITRRKCPEVEELKIGDRIKVYVDNYEVVTIEKLLKSEVRHLDSLWLEGDICDEVGKYLEEQSKAGNPVTYDSIINDALRLWLKNKGTKKGRRYGEAVERFLKEIEEIKEIVL